VEECQRFPPGELQPEPGEAIGKTRFDGAEGELDALGASASAQGYICYAQVHSSASRAAGMPRTGLKKSGRLG
jgi:hypothetical protein